MVAEETGFEENEDVYALFHPTTVFYRGQISATQSNSAGNNSVEVEFISEEEGTPAEKQMVEKKYIIPTNVINSKSSCSCCHKYIHWKDSNVYAKCNQCETVLPLHTQCLHHYLKYSSSTDGPSLQDVLDDYKIFPNYVCRSCLSPCFLCGATHSFSEKKYSSLHLSIMY